MERKETKECRRCGKGFTHDIELGDDTPSWVLCYCSELCRLKDVRTHTGVLLIKIRAMIEHDHLSKERLTETIDSYEDQLRYDR